MEDEVDPSIDIEKQGEKPTVWVNAALWFHAQGNCMDRVKNIFFRGLQRHPECEMLYTAFFNILLAETAGQSKEFQDASLERVIAIYNTAKKKICNVSFLINLIKQCDDARYNNFTKPLQKIIINDMMDLYAREERVWDLLAQRELKGASMSEYFNTRITDTEPDDPNGDSTTVKQPTLKRRIEMCFSIYQTATQTLKTQLMWTLFINAMLELNTDLSTQQVLKRKKLAIAFRSAHEHNSMSEDHYHAYINLLMETKANRDYVVSVMAEATSLYGTLKLWEQRLTYHVMEDNQNKVYEIFRRATRQLGVASFPLWKITLQYYQTRYDDQFERLKDIFKEACERPEPIFGVFRAQFLEWSVVNQTFNATRKLYLELIKLPPPCLELHQRMALLESQALKPDVEKLRQVHELAVTDFGKGNFEVWIDYIRFERDDGEPKRMGPLAERAKKTLEPSLIENFVTEHCLLTIGS